MKRFDMDESGMLECANGDWIRYADHIEAMKRIAGDSAGQEPIGKVLSDAEMGVGFDRRMGPVIWFGTLQPGFIYAAQKYLYESSSMSATPPAAVHASDCAVHNEPAYPAGPCDCGAEGK